MARPPRKWVVLLPILIGVAAFAMMKKGQRLPEQAEVGERPQLVRVIEVPSLAVRPKAKGNGTVQPVRVWEGLAQVSGVVVEKHPGLQKGSILEQGTLVLRIDPTDYQLKIAQTEADIAATRAQLEELSVKESNTRAALQIEEQALELARKELERKRELIGKGGVSTSDLEAQERSLLAQRQSVLGQRNALNLIPSQRSLLDAQLARHQANLATLQRDLEHTEIRLPFTGRVAEVNVEEEQYVREGEVLLVADDLSRAEVEVQIPINRFAPLARSTPGGDTVGVEGARQLGLKAEVRLREDGVRASWPAELTRLSDTLDPKARTIGAIVEVAGPYTGVEPGVRPPLYKGLFVEVELTGRPIPDSLVVPRSALHDGRLYLVNGEGRLERRPVEVALVQPGYVVIGGGISAGERVVVSDLIPAIEGMLLTPQPDPGVLAELMVEAVGEAP